MKKSLKKYVAKKYDEYFKKVIHLLMKINLKKNLWIIKKYYSIFKMIHNFNVEKFNS